MVQILCSALCVDYLFCHTQQPLVVAAINNRFTNTKTTDQWGWISCLYSCGLKEFALDFKLWSKSKAFILYKILLSHKVYGRALKSLQVCGVLHIGKQRWWNGESEILNVEGIWVRLPIYDNDSVSILQSHISLQVGVFC